MRKQILIIISRIHIFLYRVSGGRLGDRVIGLRFLLLVTTGRKSGKRRVTPLLYFGHEKDFLVVASNGGQEAQPDWYYNLLSNPEVSIQVGENRMNAVARQAGPQERQQLWEQHIKGAPFYTGYQKKTSRLIPLILLIPH